MTVQDYIGQPAYVPTTDDAIYRVLMLETIVQHLLERIEALDGKKTSIKNVSSGRAIVAE